MLLKDQMLSGTAIQWTNYVFVWKIFLTMDSRKGQYVPVLDPGGGGGVLPYMGYIGTCHGIGYGF